MSKKTIIVSIAVVVFLALAGGASYYAYQQGYFAGKLTPEKLLAFDARNSKLDQATLDWYQGKFNETKGRLQQNPDEFDSWLFLGILKKGVSDYQGARDVWTYAAQIRPKGSTAYANLADLYANFLNQPEKGLQNIDKAIDNDASDYNFYLIKADIYRYHMAGQEGKYETVMLEGLQKFPDNPNLIAPLALYYRQTNQLEKAAEYYEKLVKISPANQAAKQDLAEIKAELKK